DELVSDLARVVEGTFERHVVSLLEQFFELFGAELPSGQVEVEREGRHLEDRSRIADLVAQTLRLAPEDDAHLGLSRGDSDSGDRLEPQQDAERQASAVSMIECPQRQGAGLIPPFQSGEEAGSPVKELDQP
ncbi:MAG: hypothetical protein ACRDNY_03465, partial [Gaiellaceae bacterium]